LTDFILILFESTLFFYSADELPPYEDESFMEKNYLRNSLLDDSPREDRLLDDKDIEKSSSENDTENNASGLDVEMDLSP